MTSIQQRKDKILNPILSLLKQPTEEEIIKYKLIKKEIKNTFYHRIEKYTYLRNVLIRFLTFYINSTLTQAVHHYITPSKNIIISQILRLN
ncbi:hypothetical protein H312_00753 [Anncaliia algerae PRA339]|uniref:Uncharacterized protein n=1 Tax=Anncaliia algerae PRA339 TaxID=1288291 RepID=A0A059F4C3_9MICR|nr:hypothetical protein H312_00753 [Anncaliia algerae PRA339]